jgi:hypothetical protein
LWHVPCMCFHALGGLIRLLTFWTKSHSSHQYYMYVTYLTMCGIVRHLLACRPVLVNGVLVSFHINKDECVRMSASGVCHAITLISKQLTGCGCDGRHKMLFQSYMADAATRLLHAIGMRILCGCAHCLDCALPLLRRDMCVPPLVQALGASAWSFNSA